jgi:hypothetical protein
MRYFFNDVEVTKEFYLDRMANSTVDVPSKFTTVSPIARVSDVAPAKVKQRKPVPVAKGGSKIDQAMALYKDNPDLSDSQLVTLFMLKLGDITKGNASIYLKKVKARI